MLRHLERVLRAINPSYRVLREWTYSAGQPGKATWLGQGLTSVPRELAFCETHCEAFLDKDASQFQCYRVHTTAQALWILQSVGYD